jgi:hypothetical protein
VFNGVWRPSLVEDSFNPHQLERGRIRVAEVLSIELVMFEFQYKYTGGTCTTTSTIRETKEFAFGYEMGG